MTLRKSPSNDKLIEKNDPKERNSVSQAVITFGKD